MYFYYDFNDDWQTGLNSHFILQKYSQKQSLAKQTQKNPILSHPFVHFDCVYRNSVWGSKSASIVQMSIKQDYYMKSDEYNTKSDRNFFMLVFT